jgi:hypothetical protein
VRYDAGMRPLLFVLVLSAGATACARTQADPSSAPVASAPAVKGPAIVAHWRPREEVSITPLSGVPPFGPDSTAWRVSGCGREETYWCRRDDDCRWSQCFARMARPESMAACAAR